MTLHIILRWLTGLLFLTLWLWINHIFSDFAARNMGQMILVAFVIDFGRWFSILGALDHGLSHFIFDFFI